MESRDRRFLWGTLAVLVVLTAVMLGVLARPALRLEYFFDEAWRADMIRTPWTLARYRLHDTPIPPGWLAGMWAIFAVLPSKRPIVRLVALMPYFVAVGFGFDAMRRLLRTRTTSDRQYFWRPSLCCRYRLFPSLRRLRRTSTTTSPT